MKAHASCYDHLANGDREHVPSQPGGVPLYFRVFRRHRNGHGHPQQHLHRHRRRLGPGRGHGGNDRRQRRQRGGRRREPRPAKASRPSWASRRASRRPTCRTSSRPKLRSTWRCRPSAPCTAWSTAPASPWPRRPSARRARIAGVVHARDHVNLIGTFNMIRVAAEVMSKQTPIGVGRARRDREHRIGRGLRRPDRAGGLLGVEGRRRRHDAADRARPGAQRHPRCDHRARHLRDADAEGHAARKSRTRSASRCRSRRAWASPPSTRRWCKHIVENEMLNGETIRLDGAIRMGPK